MKRLVLFFAAAAIAAAPLGGPHPKVSLMFTVKGHVSRGGAVYATRGGQRLYYVLDSTDLAVHDRTTNRDTLVMHNIGACGVAIAPAGNHLAFCRRGEGGDGTYVWTVALDPATGLTAGVPRRVSMTRGNNPAFSPDGRSIAFDVEASPGVENLVVVPVTGGPERTLARTWGDIWPLTWLADGIYFGLSSNDAKHWAKNGLYRLDTSGGSPRRIAHTAEWGAFPGISPLGNVVIYADSTWDSVVVATPSGKRLASYTPSDEGLPDIWLDATHGVRARSVWPRSVEIMSLAGGTSRVVSDSAQTYHEPFWSPDGSQIAVAFTTWQLVLSRADGSNRRVIKLKRPTQHFIPEWSPDGRSILYRGVRDNHVISVLDVADGTSRDLVAPSSLQALLRWRSDSKAILYGVVDSAASADSTRAIQFREVTIAGGDRLLHSLRAPCRLTADCSLFVNDSLVVTWGPTQGDMTRMDYALTNIRARGATRVLYRREGQGLPFPVFSSDGAWMAVRRRSADGTKWFIDLTKTDGSAKQTLAVPFALVPGSATLIQPGAREVIVSSAPSGKEGASFYRMEIPSGKATRLATLPQDATVLGMRMSHDGRSVMYTRDHTPYVNFYELDYGELLKTSAPGAPR